MSNIVSENRIIRTATVETISAVGMLGTESIWDVVVITVGRMLDTVTVWDVMAFVVGRMLDTVTVWDMVVVIVGRMVLESSNEQFVYAIYCTLILLCAQSGGSMVHIKS